MRDRQIIDLVKRIEAHAEMLRSIDLATFDDKGRIFERSGRTHSRIDNAFLEAYRSCQQSSGRGFPSNTAAEPSGRSGGHGESTTERAALARDPFETDLRVAAATLTRIERDLRDLTRFVIRHLAPTADTSTALREDCASCLRAGRHVTPFRTPESIEGVPAKPLCNWCYKVALAEGCWPPREMLDLHHAGKRISERDMRAALASR